MEVTGSFLGRLPTNDTILHHGIGPLFLHSSRNVDVGALAEDIVSISGGSMKSSAVDKMIFHRVKKRKGIPCITKRSVEIVHQETLPKSTYRFSGHDGLLLAKIHDLAGSAPIVDPTSVGSAFGGKPIVTTLAIEFTKGRLQGMPLAYLASKIIADRPEVILILARLDESGREMILPFRSSQKNDRSLQHIQRSLLNAERPRSENATSRDS